MLDRASVEGGTMFGQCHSTVNTSLYSFRTRMPFDLSPLRQLRSLPQPEQVASLRERDTRDALIGACHAASLSRPVSALVPMRADLGGRSLGVIAWAIGKDPCEVMIDLALEEDLLLLFGFQD